MGSAGGRGEAALLAGGGGVGGIRGKLFIDVGIFVLYNWYMAVWDGMDPEQTRGTGGVDRGFLGNLVKG